MQISTNLWFVTTGLFSDKVYAVIYNSKTLYHCNIKLHFSFCSATVLVYSKLTAIVDLIQKTKTRKPEFF